MDSIPAEIVLPEDNATEEVTPWMLWVTVLTYGMNNIFIASIWVLFAIYYTASFGQSSAFGGSMQGLGDLVGGVLVSCVHL